MTFARSYGRLVSSIATLLILTLGLRGEVSGVAPAQAIDFQREQAVAGRKLYAEHCASCHGAALEGNAGPGLAGERFRAAWLDGNHKFIDLFNLVQQTMPVGAPGSLNGEDYLSVVLYLLSQNGYHPTGESLAAADIRKVLMPPADTSPVALVDAAEPTTPFPQPPVGHGVASTNFPGDAEIASPAESDWLLYNKDFTGSRFSKLDKIDGSNAARLVPVCLFQPGEIGSFQPAPIVYRGILYFTTPFNTFAIDATNCRKLWEHRYPLDDKTPWTVNRGVALYRGKVLRVTPDGHLIALDAASGKLLWDVWMSTKKKGYWLSAAPVAWNGLVYMGTAGADWGANGRIEAFDTETGALRWSFDVIPTGRQTGAETWGKGAERGGGSVWSTFTIDAAQHELLVSVGNPAPDFRDDVRPGDNLFTNSVVALDLASGKLKWWVQQVPHDTHDWDTAAAPTIYDIEGRRLMAVANKGGWLYLYDRKTRQLLAQPEIAPHLNIDIPLTEQGVRHCPGTLGGAEWNGAAYAPPARTLYVNTVHWCSTTQIFDDKYIEGSSYFDGIPALDPVSEARGFLHAIDASTGRITWQREFQTPMVAGITPTAGGVLFTGTLDGHFLVLDAKDGRTLYDFATGGAIAGSPSTYMVDGRQYVAVPAGNASRVVWQTGGAMLIAIFALNSR